MDISNFTKAVIAVVILAVVVVTVAIPIIGSMDSASGTNSGETARYDLGGSHGIEVSASGDVTIDGVAMANPSSTTMIVIADTFTVSMSSAGALTIADIEGTTYTASTSIADGSTVSIRNGTMTVTPSTGGATTYTYTDAYVYDADGRYGLYTSGTIKALSGTTVTAYVSSSTQRAFVDIKGGEVQDPRAWTISSSTATAVTVTAANATYTENEDGSVSYTLPVSLTYTTSSSISATGLIAPVSYGIENQEAISSMIGLIPLLIVVGLIVAVIAVFIRSRA